MAASLVRRTDFRRSICTSVYSSPSLGLRVYEGVQLVGEVWQPSRKTSDELQIVY